MYKHEKGTKSGHVLGTILSVLLLGLIVLNLGAVLGSAQSVPYPIRGYVLDDEGSPVEGATVTAILGTSTDSTTSNAAGWYMVDGAALDGEEGDTILIMATSGTDAGSTTVTIDYEVDVDDANITLGIGGAGLFLTTFFAYDENGAGVANVSINVTLGGVLEETLTTNATGIAVAFLGVGDYEWTAETDDNTLFDRTGAFEILDDNRTVLIDMSIRDTLQNILGYEISDTCLFIVVVAIFAGLLLLIGVHVGGMSKGMKKETKGAMGTGTIVLIIGAVIVALIMLGGYTLDFTVSGFMGYFGLTYGVIGSTTESVGMFLLVIMGLVGTLMMAFNGLAAAGAFDQKKALAISLLIAGLTCWMFLLVPGYPKLSSYAFLGGLVCFGGLFLAHLNKNAMPSGATASSIGIGIGAVLSIMSVLAIYNVLAGTSTLFAAAFMPLIPMIRKDNKGTWAIFNVPGKNHVAAACVIGMVFCIAFGAYGAVEVAASEDWLVISFGILDSYHSWTIGFLLAAGFLCLIGVVSKWNAPSRAWLLFGMILSFALASTLYLYWYKVLPYLGLAIMGLPFMVAEIAAFAAVATAAVGIGLLSRRSAQKKIDAMPAPKLVLQRDEQGAASFTDLVLFGSVLLGLPMVWIVADNYYGFSDGTGNFFKWMIFVIYGVAVYAAVYLFKINQK